MKALHILIVISLASLKLTAGGWPQPKGSLYLKLSQWWIVYDEYYDHNGIRTKLDRTRSIGNTSIYAEYGLTNRITTILYFPFFSKATIFELKNATTGDILKEGEAISSIGDTNIGLSYAIVNKPSTAVSANLTFGLPFGIKQGGSDGSLQTGDGEFNQMLKIEAARSFKLGQLYPYIITYVGFNNRTNQFSDEVQYGGELGLTTSVLTFIIRINAVSSLNNGSAAETLFTNIPAANNTEYLNLSPEINVNFSDQSGLSFAWSKALSGKQYFANSSYTIGFFVKI